MDSCGFDSLGADVVPALPALVPTGPMTPQGLALYNQAQESIALQQRLSRESAMKFRGEASAVMAPALGSLVGAVVFGIGGALLWAAHRVAGGLLGGLLVGPAIGGGIGFVIAARKITHTSVAYTEKK